MTTPGGKTVTSSGRANKIGYFYRPSDDFVVTEAGMYTVNVRVTHQAGDLTSAGPMQISVTGGVLGTSDGVYSFYVIPRDSPSVMVLDTPRTGATLRQATGQNPQVESFNPFSIRITPPVGLTNVEVGYTTNLTGTVLESGTLSAANGAFSYSYDLGRLPTDARVARARDRCRASNLYISLASCADCCARLPHYHRCAL